MNKKFIPLLLFFFISTEIFSQVAVPFSVRRQIYVKGDMTMIANNIVNRQEFLNSPNTPYNKIDSKTKLNDEFDMQYIDIDTDKTTFSSSSAKLILDKPEQKKILYAGLYWSATYTTKSSKRTGINIFTASDTTRESFDKIRIKLPNENQYNEIHGNLIFDGVKDSNFSESAPYAMYADITDLVKKSSSPLGTYTVANIKSTVGVVSGGVSAGWSIFFIYEDTSMSGKFITTYDGFSGVTKTPVDINFSGFQTLAVGKINAKVACAALEGDFNLGGDQLSFKSENALDFTKLSDTNRDKVNIFNSSITLDNNIFSDRVPNSMNTLGYDSFIMSIQNPNNSIIENNSNGATLNFKTFGDRYFVFFNAFIVEVTPPIQVISPEELNQEKEFYVEANQKVHNVELNLSEKEIAVVQQAKGVETVNVAPKNDFVKSENSAEVKISSKNANNNLSYKRASFNKDYYLVAGVFQVPSNATKFMKKLKAKGVQSYSFVNPKNNLRYVYISKNKTYKSAFNLYASKVNGKYKQEIWILGVKKQTNSSLVEI
jgi:hypothetical protein